MSNRIAIVADFEQAFRDQWFGYFRNASSCEGDRNNEGGKRCANRIVPFVVPKYVSFAEALNAFCTNVAFCHFHVMRLAVLSRRFRYLLFETDSVRRANGRFLCKDEFDEPRLNCFLAGAPSRQAARS